MKRYIYILLAATLFLGSCQKSSEFDETLTPSTENFEDGSCSVSLNLKMKSAKKVSVETRAEISEFNIVDGWAVVFGAVSGEVTDASPLLQKVPFEVDSDGSTILTFRKQEGACIIRLLGNLTAEAQQQVTDLVSQKEIANGASGAVSTFADYKDISVDLSGYYADPANPCELQSTKNGFPCASSAVSMPDGLNEESVNTLTSEILEMESAASKLDVWVSDGCDFELYSVRLINGANRGLLRNTLKENNGAPLPTNLGGVNTEYSWADAVHGMTTVETPIYLFPNAGNDPLQTGEAPNYPNEEAVSTATNPTYLILAGKAAGYAEMGFYKIALRYKVEGSDKLIYDIKRNTYYEVKLNQVDGPGYATYDEAVNGLSDDVSYDIEVDTEDDVRNETIISNSGLFSMEISASRVYVRGWSETGIDLDLSVWFGKNEDVTDFDYSNYPAHISTQGGITLETDGDIPTITTGEEHNVRFNVSGNGIITLRYGDITKDIPVVCENRNVSLYNQSQITINGMPVFDGLDEALYKGEAYYIKGEEERREPITDFGVIFNHGNAIKYPNVDATRVDMTNFHGRVYDGYIYPSDMSRGVVRLYYHQGCMRFHNAYELNAVPNTDEDPYYMVNYEDFDHLAKTVPSQSFYGHMFEVVRDIDLREDVADRIHASAGSNGGAFSGYFDGRHRTISNLYTDPSSSCAGLIGRISYATIKDLTVKGGVVGVTNVGGIVGTSVSRSTLENCIYEGSVSGEANVGGLVGYLDIYSEIKNCENRATVKGIDAESNTLRIGGVVGRMRASNIESCTNRGDIIATTTSLVGGIVGYNSSYSTTASEIINCVNYSAITGLQQVGGIAGYSGGISYDNKTLIKDCRNEGAITTTAIKDASYSSGGGISGQCSYVNFENCSNSGDVTGDPDGKARYNGGITGFASNANFENCTNSGDVFAYGGAGGISGFAYTITSSDVVIPDGEYLSHIRRCTNSGNITSIGTSGTNLYSGGICGSITIHTSVSDCTNSGVILGKVETGGVLGCLGSTCIIMNCYNTGAVNGESNVSGVVGQGNGGDMYNCYNVAEVTGEREVGLVLGGNVDNTSCDKCYYLSSLAGANGFGISKTAAAMKKDSFVTLLNGNADDAAYASFGLSDWAKDTQSVNGGYPIFNY